MATENDPGALDAPIQPGGVPRHASAKERKGRGIKPFLSDLKAEVQNQLARSDGGVRPRGTQVLPAEVTHVSAQAAQVSQAVTRGQDRTAQDHTAQDHTAHVDDHGVALATAALATADHAGAEAVAARADAAEAREDAEAARAEAAAARSDAATAQATAARADAQLQAARAEIDAAHQEFGALRAEFDAARERAVQHVRYAWIGAGAATALSIIALLTPLLTS